MVFGVGVDVLVFIDWSQRGKLFYFLLCPSWAVFFIGCMPSGINFLHRSRKADGREMKTRNLRDIHLEYPVFNRKLWKAASGISWK